MSQTSDLDTTLELRHTYTASPERVFRAWIEATSLSRWFAPSDEYQAIVHDLEVRVGGRYRIEMRHSGGASHVAYGEYREIEPHRRLSFTWRWEANPSMPETLVTVAITPQGEKSELVLTHQRFADAKMRDDHTKGWSGCLERLTRIL